MNKDVERYLHFMHDTLILLGCEERFAKLLDYPELINIEDINDLRNYNCKLLDSLKDRLCGIHKIEIKVE